MSSRFTILLLILTLSLLSANACGNQAQTRFQQSLNAAKQGDVAAMYATGQMHELGLGTARNRKQVLRWYRSAAKKKHPDGAYQLGYAYYWGRGVRKNRRSAHEWFLLAAEQGNRAAIPYLTKMYRLGQGVARDRQAAQAWSRVLADMNIKAAQRISRPQAEPQQAAASDKAISITKLVTSISSNHWYYQGRPTYHLSSAQSECLTEENNLVCISKPIDGSLSGRQYSYEIANLLSDFTPAGRFTLTYQARLIEITGDIGQTEAVKLREQIASQQDRLSCKAISESLIRCLGSNGTRLDFSRESGVPTVEAAGAVSDKQVTD